MKILYFTSTGNSLYVAKTIGGDLFPIPKVVKNKEYTFCDDVIGIIFPVYGMSVPPYIREFLSNAKFKCNYLFAVITYGTYAAATISDLLNIAKANDMHFSYINKLKMVQNYVPGFEMEKQVKKLSEKKLGQELNHIIFDIENKKQWIYHDSFLGRFVTWSHKKKYPFNCGTGITKSYQLENSCSGCGTCVEVCPMNNIHLSASKPVFGTSCISCLACTHNCPKNSIRLSNEKSSIRFRNPNVKLEEIIASNR